MRKAAALAVLAALLFPASTPALTTEDVMRVLCYRRAVRVRGCCARVYYVPSKVCVHDFGLSVQE